MSAAAGKIFTGGFSRFQKYQLSSRFVQAGSYVAPVSYTHLVLAALATGVAAFVPFIIGSAGARGWEALLTPFEVYFGGLGKYPYVALNTYNPVSYTHLDVYKRQG